MSKRLLDNKPSHQSPRKVKDNQINTSNNNTIQQQQTTNTIVKNDYESKLKDQIHFIDNIIDMKLKKVIRNESGIESPMIVNNNHLQLVENVRVLDDIIHHSIQQLSGNYSELSLLINKIWMGYKEVAKELIATVSHLNGQLQQKTTQCETLQNQIDKLLDNTNNTTSNVSNTNKDIGYHNITPFSDTNTIKNLPRTNIPISDSSNLNNSNKKHTTTEEFNQKSLPEQPTTLVMTNHRRHGVDLRKASVSVNILHNLLKQHTEEDEEDELTTTLGYQEDEKIDNIMENMMKHTAIHDTINNNHSIHHQTIINTNTNLNTNRVVDVNTSPINLVINKNTDSSIHDKSVKINYKSSELYAVDNNNNNNNSNTNNNNNSSTNNNSVIDDYDNSGVDDPHSVHSSDYSDTISDVSI